MKIINAQASVLVENDPIKKIEKCGRVCYKSEDKITEDSAEKFVANIIKRGHEAVLEHASFIFQVSYNVYEDIRDKVIFVENRYPVKMYLRFTDSDGYVVSGNVRAWRDFFCFAGVPPYMNDFVEANKVKLSMLSIDESKGKEKKVAVHLYVRAKDFKGAVSNVEAHMSTSAMDYTIASVSETAIMDVFDYKPRE